MKLQNGIKYTPPRWVNSIGYNVSYIRLYKNASSTVVDLLGTAATTPRPWYKKRFTVLRDPVTRAISIYKQLSARPQLKKVASFSGYLKYTLKNGFFDKHQFPQTFWLKNFDGLQYFTVENINELADYLGAPMENIKHLNKKDADIEPTAKDLRIIKKLYEKDFELYNQTISPQKIT